MFRDHQHNFGAGRGIFVVLFLALLVLLAVWIISSFVHRRDHLPHGPGQVRMSGGPAGPPNPDAQRILEERFARGEIDTDEFKSKRDILRDHS